jgi:hypothetical protein
MRNDQRSIAEKTAKREPAVILLLSDARGVYIPRDFANEIRREFVSGVSAEDWAILEAGPDHESYWEAWDDVINNAVITLAGDEYRIHPDGDCWLLCDARLDVEERQNFLNETEEEAKREVYGRDDKLVMCDAPSAWASYLVNGDASGLEDDEIKACDAWLASEKLGAPVDCFDAGFCHSHDARAYALPGDCQTYVFHRTDV